MPGAVPLANARELGNGGAERRALSRRTSGKE